MSKTGSHPEPLVSVVVPVYNVEKYLAACLNSILAQTYRNIEVICVNDGSPDGSERIIDEYCQQDPRVRKVNQENAGLNMARAAGYKKSKGEHIMFVDSDDLIHEQTIAIALKPQLESAVDMSVFGYAPFSKSPASINPTITDEYTLLEGGADVLRYMLVNHPQYRKRTLQLTVWGKLYSRRLLEKIDWKLANYRQHEDILWSPQAFRHAAKGISLNASTLYYYRKDPSRTVLSRAVEGNTVNGRPVGYLELVHRYVEYVYSTLRAKDFDKGLLRELEDSAYGMYRGHMQDLAERGLVGIENNIDFIPEYVMFSEKHIQNIIDTVDAQDARIKRLEGELHSLQAQLNPQTASLKQVGALLKDTVHLRAKRRLGRN